MPALAIVGASSTAIVRSEMEERQGGFEIVHLKTFIPSANPVMVVLGKSEFVITPVPEINDQVPTPVPGTLPVIVVVGVEIQSVWLEPALATVGTCLTSIVTFEVEGGHAPLDIIH